MIDLKPLFTIVSLLAFVKGSFAISAYPHKIPICIGKDTVYIRLFGDEHTKYAETIDGYTILQQDDVWYYANKTSSGELVPSEYKLSKQVDGNTQLFLENLPCHLKREKACVRDNLEVGKNSLGKGAVGTRRILVILMQYNDLSFVKSPEEFFNLFNSVGYREDGAQGSVVDYYTDVSYGKLQLICDIIGPFTSRYERAHYGGNDVGGDDKNPEKLFEEAMDFASSQVKLSDYDSDHDGYVDNVHIIFAGHGEEAGASSDAIWSHEATFQRGVAYQDMLVDRYSCAPELRGNRGEGISRIGPHCHEIGHALGAMDYYDTNYNEQGGYTGTGQWDIMASGSWNEDGIIPADFNPYVKLVNFGWIEAPEMPNGEIVIPPSSSEGYQYYRLSNTLNDYYLLENRSYDKWGAALPGSGLLIFHIHPNISSGTNTINATHPQQCYPVCAFSNYQFPTSSSDSYGNINSSDCPFPGTSGKREFNNSTSPRPFSWNNQESLIDLRNIHIASNGDVILDNHTSLSGFLDGKVLLEDHFEAEHSLNIDDREGYARWNWYILPEGTVLKGEMKPHDGSGCIVLKPTKVVTGSVNCSVTFDSSISANENPSSLSFYYQGEAYEPGDDMLSVSYKCDNSAWESISLSEDSIPGWKNINIDLPPSRSYQIKFTGRSSYGQGIYVDDLILIQKSSTGVRDIYYGENMLGQKVIYSLIGRKLTSLKKGINIVKQSDGTFKKVFVK